MKILFRCGVVATLILAVVVCQGCMLDSVKLNRKAQIYIKHGQYDNAIPLLKESLNINYENPGSHYYLAESYAAQGDHRNALWHYELAVQFDPSYEQAQLAIIRELHRVGRTEDSIEAARMFLEHKGAISSYFTRLETTFLAEKMIQHAVLAAEAAVKADPSDPTPYITIAQHYYDNGNNENGDEFLVRAFRTKPTWPGLAEMLGKHGMRVEIPKPTFLTKPSPAEQEISNLEN